MELNKKNLSAEDLLKNRVIIAKSNIPIGYGLKDEFCKRYPQYEEKKVKAWLNTQGSNKNFTEHLEEMAGSFTNLNRKQ